MLTAAPEYETKHLVKFLKEEFERIIVQCGRGAGDSLLSDAQALAIWFLHQEVGMTYDAANPCVARRPKAGTIVVSIYHLGR